MINLYERFPDYCDCLPSCPEDCHPGCKPRPLRVVEDKPCWCISMENPHEGWIHSPRCIELGEKYGSN